MLFLNHFIYIYFMYVYIYIYYIFAALKIYWWNTGKTAIKRVSKFKRYIWNIFLSSHYPKKVLIFHGTSIVLLHLFALCSKTKWLDLIFLLVWNHCGRSQKIWELFSVLKLIFSMILSTNFTQFTFLISVCLICIDSRISMTFTALSYVSIQS